MSAFTHSHWYVLRVLLAQAGRLDAPPRRLYRLRAHFFDPYRPELHYMRGPGPKWREKYKQAHGC
jgi:hypothetical protein